MTAALAMLVWVALVLAAYAIIADPSDSRVGRRVMGHRVGPTSVARTSGSGLAWVTVRRCDLTRIRHGNWSTATR